jgi:hypothetical protein
MAEGSNADEEKRRPTRPPVEFLKPGETQAPLPPRDQSPAAWVPRPEDYQAQPSWPAPPAAPAGASNLPKFAGILLLVSAGIGMAGALYGALTLPTPAEYTNITQNTPPAVLAAGQICGLISIWSQAMALLGGIMALQRMNWKLTIVCAIFSLGTLGIFLFEASLIGFLALIVTLRARPYFLS